MADAAAPFVTLEAQRCQAMLQADLPALRALLAPQLRYLHSTGVCDDRDSLLAKFERGQMVYAALELRVRTVTVTAEAAIVDGEMRAQVQRGSERLAIASRYLAVWLRAGDGWQLAMFQGTALPAH